MIGWTLSGNVSLDPPETGFPASPCKNCVSTEPNYWFLPGAVKVILRVDSNEGRDVLFRTIINRKAMDNNPASRSKKYALAG
jgi:hypothetical protein